MKSIRVLLPLLSLLLVQTIAAAALAQDMPGQEIMLPESEVCDRFFAYMIGLVQADACGRLDADHLISVLGEFKGKTSIPFERIESIYRDCGAGKMGDVISGGGSTRRGGARDVSITFHDELKTPVPYDILGYHPGSVQASSTVKFREWYIPQKTLRWKSREPLDLSEIYVFGIYEGWTVIDIDAWLDALLGGALDDTRIITLVLFKYDGDWHGLAAGFGNSNEGRSGVFNFTQDKILFPTPPEFRGIGPYFRNFVTDVKGLEVPLPPSSKWKQDK